jgi:hypothetical protein
MVNGTQLPPIEDTMYRGARWEKGPMTGVTTRRTNMTIATRLLKMMIGHRRPRKGPSEIQTAMSE